MDHLCYLLLEIHSIRIFYMQESWIMKTKYSVNLGGGGGVRLYSLWSAGGGGSLYLHLVRRCIIQMFFYNGSKFQPDPLTHK